MKSTLQSHWDVESESTNQINTSWTKVNDEPNKKAPESDKQNKSSDKRYHRAGFYFKSCLCGAVPGMLVAGIVLAIAITFWMSSPQQTSTDVSTTTLCHHVSNNAIKLI
ncbi:unnamed protein product [Rotaria magnacalcarata]|uniref:Uncharacterized protein n=1 Tax=Rotaria magnacalcarata TaxID=392030 RepID=A0A8S2R291_9BILA|nr:unnamed protein product [Rotaria magnacalcarata]